MNTKNCIIASLVFISLFFMSCMERISPASEEDKDTEFPFDFSTSKTTTLTLNYDVPKGYRVYFEAYTANPIRLDIHKNYIKNKTLTPFLSGYTNENGDIEIPVTLSTAVEEIYVYSNDVGVPVLLKGVLSGDRFEMSKATFATTKSVPQTKSRTTDENYYTGWKTQNVKYETIGAWNNNGQPKYLLDEKISLSDKTLKIIDATLRVDEYTGASFFIHEDLRISEDANVKLYFLANSSQRKNVLAYYTYSGNTVPTKEYINNNLVILYPNLTENAIGKYAGVALKYKKDGQWSDVIPAGTNIGWVLLIDAFDENKGINTNGINTIYSAKRYNAYNFVGTAVSDRPHTGLFKADGRYVLSFEDQPFGRANNPGGGQTIYDADYKDDVFIIESNPISALPDVPNGTDPENPFENDTKVSTHGTLAFEDLWPHKGDFDMNDVVVSYASTSYMNPDYFFTGMEDTYTFRNNGANYENGFGFTLNTDRTNIKSIEVTPNTFHQGEALDPDLKQATIIIFDNGHKVPIGTTFTVKVSYQNPVSPVGYNPGPSNSFITVKGIGDNRKEVHFINKKPTEKADLSPFHTGDDLSVPEKGKYYISNAQYPFAINIIDLDNYSVPTEGRPIDETYPRFKRWAESLGKDNKDWYNYPAK